MPQWPLLFVLYDRSEEVFWRNADVEMDFLNVRLLGHLTRVVDVLSQWCIDPINGMPVGELDLLFEAHTGF